MWLRGRLRPPLPLAATPFGEGNFVCFSYGVGCNNFVAKAVVAAFLFPISIVESWGNQLRQVFLVDLGFVYKGFGGVGWFWGLDRIWWRGEEGNLVVARFALHDGLRQSGKGFIGGCYGTTEVVPFRFLQVLGLGWVGHTANPHLMKRDVGHLGWGEAGGIAFPPMREKPRMNGAPGRFWLGEESRFPAGMERKKSKCNCRSEAKTNAEAQADADTNADSSASLRNDKKGGTMEWQRGRAGESQIREATERQEGKLGNDKRESMVTKGRTEVR
jgi:hypothetical protein